MAGLIDHGAFVSSSTSSFVMGPVAVWGRGSMEAERKAIRAQQAVSAPHTQPDNFWSELLAPIGR